MNKRYALAQALNQLGLLNILGKLSWRSAHFIVLAYHRVTDVKPSSFLFDDGVISATPRQFEEHLRFIKKHFSVISPDDLCEHLSHNAPLPRHPVMITFDDGYRDNYENAFPLLMKYGLKGTFFISTKYINERKLFWWDKISLAIKSSKREKIRMSYPLEMELNLKDPLEKEAAIAHILRTIKQALNFDIDLFLEQLRAETGATTDDRKMADSLILSWEQIRKMSDNGMEIGSHTDSHPVLSNLPENRVRAELLDSKMILETQLGKSVRALSYPVGGRSFNDSTRRIARESGYLLAFSYGTGVNLTSALEPLNIRRIGIEHDFPQGYFKAALTVPWLHGSRELATGMLK